jgi:DNA-directed RNA polymerase specialized sigma24 family protein
MDDQPAQKEEWVLTHQALDRLLEHLDPDRDRAAEKYEQIRQRLIKLFRWRGCLLFEEYTDRTIDRVARRIAGGLEVQSANVYSLFHGVALNILKEHWRKSERESEALDDLFHSHDTTENPEDIRAEEEERREQEARLNCLRRCLGGLAHESRTLIKRYYAEGNVLNKEQRKQIAAEMRISVNALRVRACRVRGEVEQCIDRCLYESR